MSKLTKMQRYLPGLYRPQTNVHVKGLITAWASEDDRIVEAIQNAKDQIFVKLASLQYLDALGSNVGVFRPTAIALADEQYRALIPILSFYPKQVMPTIQKVLDVFFTENNPRVATYEINPNEIVIEIPSSVPSLRRELKGSLHLHAYSGTITVVDNVLKIINVDLEIESKALAEDELRGASLGVGSLTTPILSNSAGNTSTIQFAASADLSGYTVLDEFNIVNVPNYQGSFLPNPSAAWSLRSNRGALGMNLSAGRIYPVLTMVDSSGIPDEVGKVIINYGKATQEGPITYLGRPGNSSILLDPSYIFTKDHSIGEIVNTTFTPYQKPAIDGTDLSVYLVGVEAARILAQQIVETVIAAGIVIRWIVSDPTC